MRFDRIGAIAAGLILAGVALGLRLYRFEWPHTSALDALQAGTLPPGLHWDEAYNTLAALRLWREGGFEPFIRIDLGRMPLHIYLTTLIFALFGPITVGGRMAALIPGLLNLLIIGVLARAPFRDNLSETEQRNLAWLVTGQMAVTYWFVHTSRIGMEHSTMAFYSTLALIALWWAVRAPTFGRAGLAGAVLGLSIYTYPAAYVLPIAALGILAHHALTQRPPRPVRLRFALAYALGFCLVLLPFILFFIRYPEWVLDRPSGVRVAPAMIGPNVINALTGFVWRGDYNTSYNLRDRPFFDPFQAALFLLGVAICLRRIRQSAYAFGLIWFGVMLLPQVFSEAPHFARNAGATVPAVFIAAIGGAAVWRWVEARARSAVLPAVAFSGLTLVSAGLTARDYFIRWPQVPDYLPTFRAAERLEAELALQAPREPVRYLSPIDSGIPTVRFILDDHPETQVESFNGRECTVLPPVERGARYFITAYEDTRTLGWLGRMYGSRLSVKSYAANGFELVKQVDVPAGQAPVLPVESLRVPDQRLGDLVQPLAVMVPAQTITTPIAELPVTLIWKVTGQTTEDLTLGLYLFGPNLPEAGVQMAAQLDRQPCAASHPTSRSLPGEWVVEERRLALAPDLPLGRYTLALALYRQPSLERLPVTDATGAPLGDTVNLAEIQVAGP
ncbi:MAG TPA: hypothetical protein VI793_03055 [Anaerolineales bacterium]|nr:hypothetical protein [Anaerolineales bacterium]